METPQSNIPQIVALDFCAKYASELARTALFLKKQPTKLKLDSQKAMLDRLKDRINYQPIHPKIQCDTFAFGTSDKYFSETIKSAQGYALALTFDNSQMQGMDNYGANETIDMAIGIYHPVEGREYSNMEVAAISLDCYDKCKQILWEMHEMAISNTEMYRWMEGTQRIINNDIYNLTGYCIQFKFSPPGYIDK